MSLKGSFGFIVRHLAPALHPAPDHSNAPSIALVVQVEPMLVHPQDLCLDLVLPLLLQSPIPVALDSKLSYESCGTKW